MDYTNTTYMQRKQLLMDSYDKLMEFDAGKPKLPFAYMANRWDEFTMTGSFRQFLNTKYAALNINKLYGLDLLTWIRQPMFDIFTQMADVAVILDIQEQATKAFTESSDMLN